MSLVAEYKFPVLFINQFYPRPGTPAAAMKRIDTVEVRGVCSSLGSSTSSLGSTSYLQVKRRTRELTALFHSYQPYKGREGERLLLYLPFRMSPVTSPVTYPITCHLTCPQAKCTLCW